MKNFFLVCFAAVLMCVTGSCSTDIPNSEISPYLTLGMRCGLSGGVPIHSDQAEKIKAMVEFLNYNIDNKDQEPIDWNSLHSISSKLSNNAVLAKDYKANLDKDQYSLQYFLQTIHKQLNGGRLYYGSALMNPIYKYAYAYLSVSNPNDNSEGSVYCACGYEFCDYGSACSFDKTAKMPICATKIEMDFDKDKAECNPINLKTTSLRDTLVDHQLPLLKFLKGYRSNADKINLDDLAQNGRYKVSDLVSCDGMTDNDLKNCELAQKVYRYLVDCINIGDEELTSGDKLAYAKKCVTYNENDNVEDEGVVFGGDFLI